MIKRVLIVFLIIFSCIFISGCDSKKATLLFNSDKITKKTVYNVQSVFSVGQTINYVLLMPKGFKKDYLRMQVMKVPDNVSFGGANLYMANNVFVDTSKNFYIDKFIIRQEGNYVVRFFYANDLVNPIVESNLWVRN